MPNDPLEHYAALLATLGDPHRLQVIRCLIQQYPEWMTETELKNASVLSLETLRLALTLLRDRGLVQEQIAADPVPAPKYTLDVSRLEDLLAFFYTECCVRQRIVDWRKITAYKERWLTQAEVNQVETENLANFLDAAIYERLGGKALQVLLLARSEAVRFNQMPINTAHILLGLCLEGGSTTTHQLLEKWRLDIVKIRTLLKTIELPDAFLKNHTGFTPNALESLNYALEEATESGYILINTEHLLVGLIREWQTSVKERKPITMAAQLFQQTGRDPKVMLAELRVNPPTN